MARRRDLSHGMRRYSYIVARGKDNGGKYVTSRRAWKKREGLLKRRCKFGCMAVAEDYISADVCGNRSFVVPSACSSLLYDYIDPVCKSRQRLLGLVSRPTNRIVHSLVISPPHQRISAPQRSAE